MKINGVFLWWIYRLMAMASPMLKEVMKMRYLWQQRIVLDGQKMTDYLGEGLKKTPLKNIVRQLALVPPKSQTEPVSIPRSASYWQVAWVGQVADFSVGSALK